MQHNTQPAAHIHVMCIWPSSQIKEEQGNMSDITQDVLWNVWAVYAGQTVHHHNIQKCAKSTNET